MVQDQIEVFVYPHNHRFRSEPLLPEPITLSQCIDNKDKELCSYVCQLTKNPENRAFLELFTGEHPELVLPKAGFTLRQIKDFTWAHFTCGAKLSSLSDYYDFVME